MAGMPMGMGPMTASEPELSGTARIKWGALLGILGLLLAVVGVFLVLFVAGAAIAGSISGANYQSVLNTLFLAVAIVVVGVIFALLSFVLYTAGFASLRKADGTFTVPMALCLIGLIGLVLIAGFAGAYTAAVHTAISCSTTDTNCQDNAFNSVGAYRALEIGGALLGFIGLIGTILGLYRFGKRYTNSAAKVGAILYIIPVVAILAPVLVLIGAYQVEKKLRQPAPMPPPAAPMAPPSM